MLRDPPEIASRPTNGWVGRDPLVGKHCSKPSLDLFPRKCTYVEVTDLRIMVLWSIGFITNRHRTPHQISLCPLLPPPPCYAPEQHQSSIRAKIHLQFLTAFPKCLHMIISREWFDVTILAKTKAGKRTESCDVQEQNFPTMLTMQIKSFFQTPAELLINVDVTSFRAWVYVGLGVPL